MFKYPGSGSEKFSKTPTFHLGRRWLPGNIFDEIIIIVEEICKRSYLPVLSLCFFHLLLKYFLIVIQLICLGLYLYVYTIPVDDSSYVRSSWVL